MASFTGGCLCGRVRYTASAEPAFTGICHCRNCQHFTGSAFETVLGFPKDAVQIEGERKIYRTPLMPGGRCIAASARTAARA